tara:strand:- start:859 stop:9492 length:8634 start_codon:yes stop_codon:yes gene_type:complete
MINPYEGYKVKSLINTYRANPDMFNDDQLDELESLAEQHEINFKRLEGNFSLRRGLQQAQAGFIEGLTTMDLIPKEPRTTGEAIFRQLGHLAGFAPAIMRAPLSVFSRFRGAGMYKALEAGIKTLDDIAIPMKFSRGTKATFDKVLQKTGAESIEFLRHGSATRQITEEALGLGVASAVSSVWKGTDVMADAFVGGAIAGGAFGGIGNFVSVGKMYKGTPEQIQTANARLRAGVASMFMGLPATMRRDPIEMQIYEYLLGGFFGYNTRPAYKQAAGVWMNGKKGEMLGRNLQDILDPEHAKDWNTITKKTQDYILHEHPLGYENSEGLKGSTGASLGYLEKNFPETKWRPLAEEYIKNSGREVNNDTVHAFYRLKASDAMAVLSGRFRDAESTSAQLYSDQQSDFMDPVTREIEHLKNTDKDVYKEVDKKQFKTEQDFVAAREQATSESLTAEGGRNVEVFIDSLKRLIGNDLTTKHEGRYRRKWHTETEPTQEVFYFKDKAFGDIDVKSTKSKTFGTTSLGERYVTLPINYLGFGGFSFMTHGVTKNGQAYKILDFAPQGENVVFKVDSKKLRKIENKLEEQGKYIYSGMKDKTFMLIADYVDSLGNVQITKELIFDAMSKGDPIIRKAIEKTYEAGLESDKNMFGTNRLYERKWVSNVLHHAAMNGLVNKNSPNLQGLGLLLNKGYGKSVADLNKRLTLITNRMTPLNQASFTETISNGKMRGMIIKDIETTGNSDTDGGLIIAHKFFDAIVKYMGYDKNVGHLKPVVAGDTGLGALFTKSNGQRATGRWNDFMKENGLDFIVFDSGAKLKGQIEVNAEFTYNPKSNTFSVKNPKTFEVPIEHMQVSTGTFEDPFKSIKGDEIARQFYLHASSNQFPDFAEQYFKEILEPSLLGTERGRSFAEKVNEVRAKNEKLSDKQLKELDKIINDADLSLNELPLEFIKDTLLKFPDSRVAGKVMDKIMKLEGEGKLDIDFEFDSSSDFRQFHTSNKILAQAMAGTYAVRNTVFKENYHNALKKFLVRRFANPYIYTGGKSWLKAFTPDQLVTYKGNSIIIDPEYVQKKVKGLQEGDLYLDNMFKRMPIETKYIPEKDLEAIYQRKLKNAQKTDSKATMETIDKRVNLGEAWEQYVGNKSRKDFKEWDKTFMLLAIRIPADSVSGTRQLRFRGFTGQRGSGSFTHHKDNKYLGGADKDSDSIKLYQGISNDLRKKFVEVKDERAAWENKDGTPSDYAKEIDRIFSNADLDATEVQRFKGYNKKEGDKGYNVAEDVEYQMFMYNPAYRLRASQMAYSAKQGMGGSLNAKIAMQNFSDYILKNNNSVDFTFEDGGQTFVANIKVKKGKVMGVDRMQFFRDLGTAVVNKSADASTDPTIKPSVAHTRVLFDSLFDMKVYKANPKTGELDLVKRNGSDIKLPKDYFGYSQLKSKAINTPFSTILDALRVVKPASSVRNISWSILKDKPWIDKNGLVLLELTPKEIAKLDIEVGERVLTKDKDITYSIVRRPDADGKAILNKSRFGTGQALDIFDLGRLLTRTNVNIKKHGLTGMVPALVKRMENSGLNIESFSFPIITRAYKNLVENLPVQQQAAKNLRFVGSKELMKFIETHLGILSKEFNFDMNPRGKLDPRISQYSFAFDNIGKGLAHFSTIELLHKNFIDLHAAIDAAGVKGNAIKELIPRLIERNKKIKEELQGSVRLDKDGVLENLERQIRNTSEELLDLAVDNNFNPQPLIKYWHTLLLSPITSKKTSGFYGHNQIYKDIHSARNIPFETKKEFYGKMEEIFNRGVDKENMMLDVEVKDISTLKELAMKTTEDLINENTPPKSKPKKVDPNQFDLFNPPKAELALMDKPQYETLTELATSKAIEGLAINDAGYKEVQQFRKNLNRHRVIKENFEQWFEYFTGILSGGGKYREASTMTLEDIVAINRYFKGIQDPSRLLFKLRYWYMDPRFTDEKMATKGIINRYFQYFAPVDVGGADYIRKPVFHFTSPIGEISRYHGANERNISKDIVFYENKYYNKIEKELNKYGTEDRAKLVEELFEFREKGIVPNDPKRMAQLEALNKPVTEFFKGMHDLIYTKDSKGIKATDADGTWVMDKDFQSWYRATGGVLNKYMRWNADGKMDLQHFRRTVIDNNNINKPEVIRTVGIDGIKRYQRELKMEETILNELEHSKTMLGTRLEKEAFRQKDSFVYRDKIHQFMTGIGERDVASYMPHMNFGATKKSAKEIVTFIENKANDIYGDTYSAAIAKGLSPKIAAQRADKAFLEYNRQQENKLAGAEEFFAYGELIEPSRLMESDLNVQFTNQGSLVGNLKNRVVDMPGFDKSPFIFKLYLDKLVSSYYNNATAIKGQYEINNMKHRLIRNPSTRYKVSKAEKAQLKGSDYNNPIEVWGDYVKLYLQSILGHQSYFSTEMVSPKSPLQLKDKRNLFYLTSDENVVNIFEKYYQNKNVKAPFFKHAPKSAEARKEYFSRKLHELGRMEAQYQLMSLLANTGTWTTNIVSGSAMTIGSAGIRNFADSYSNKKIYDMLLTDGKGNEIVKLNNGKTAKNRKDLLQYLEERGVIDAFIQNEFDVNPRLRSGLKKAGVNVKTFTREITTAAKSSNPDLRVMEVIRKYNVMDTMVKYGSFFMQNSERINRLNAFTAHAIQSVKKFGVEGRELSIEDPFVFDMAMRGIENTQFLYQNSARPAFMRTAVGKVLSRFKLFVWNSVRTRKEFYRQAKLYGFKNGTPEYERFKDTYMLDLFMFSLGSAFMFSIFDTALAPPLDTFQAIADSLYGDKRERDMAFWGSKLGALQLLKPPVARIPDAAIELLTGDWEKFSSYTAYTMFPFGRGIRQLVQFSDKPERAGEIFLRLPVNQMKSRLERAKKRDRQKSKIEETLGV